MSSTKKSREDIIMELVTKAGTKTVKALFALQHQSKLGNTDPIKELKENISKEAKDSRKLAYYEQRKLRECLDVQFPESSERTCTKRQQQLKFETLLLVTWDADTKADLERLVMAIEATQNWNYQTRKDRWSPLMILAGLGAKGSLQAMLQVMKMGGDPSLLDVDGWNALHWAACHGNFAAVKELKKNRSLFVKDRKGRTPVDLARAGKFYEVANLLMEDDSSPHGNAKAPSRGDAGRSDETSHATLLAVPESQRQQRPRKKEQESDNKLNKAQDLDNLYQVQEMAMLSNFSELAMEQAALEKSFSDSPRGNYKLRLSPDSSPSSRLQSPPFASLDETAMARKSSSPIPEVAAAASFAGAGEHEARKASPPSSGDLAMERALELSFETYREDELERKPPASDSKVPYQASAKMPAQSEGKTIASSTPAATSSLKIPRPQQSGEHSEVIHELVLNGFDLEKVVRARRIVGDDFDDIVLFITSNATVRELVFNGFNVKKAAQAYSLIGDNFDDLVTYLIATADTQNKGC